MAVFSFPRSRNKQQLRSVTGSNLSFSKIFSALPLMFLSRVSFSCIISCTVVLNAYSIVSQGIKKGYVALNDSHKKQPPPAQHWSFTRLRPTPPWQPNISRLKAGDVSSLLYRSYLLLYAFFYARSSLSACNLNFS